MSQRSPSRAGMGAQGTTECRAWRQARRIACRLACASALALGCLAPVCGGQEAIERQLAQDLEQLAETCLRLNMPREAAISRQFYVRRDPRRQYVFLPPPEQQPADENQSPLVKSWRRKLTKIRQQHASRLFAAVEQENPTRVFLALHEVLYYDPDHQRAREALGFRRRGERWIRQAASTRARKGTANRNEWGFRAGQYWRIDSEHFQISTNLGRQQGLQLSQRLEQLHAVWSQVFLECWAAGVTSQRLISGAAPIPRPLNKHRVVLFANRQQYLQSLRRWQSRIELTTGIYLDRQQTSYLYASDEAPQSTWLHEITHQLFQESLRARAGVGSEANFWIVEGIAMYMESLAAFEGYVTLGGADASRLQFARFNWLNGGHYIPFERVVSLGRDDVQRDPQIRQLYSQLAGQAQFLMDHQEGRYRSALLEYLRQVYLQQSGVSSLARHCGASLAELDQQYRRFLDVRDEDLLQSPTLPQAANLSLGKTSVTAAGAQRLTDCLRLEWLNLSDTPIGDPSVALLAKAAGLRELNLERTQISNQALKTVGQLSQLQELDLSNTAVDDEGLANLAGLTNLKILWLTNCRISDAGLRHLRRLKKLESLEISGTQISDKALAELRQSLPQLKE